MFFKITEEKYFKIIWYYRQPFNQNTKNTYRLYQIQQFIALILMQSSFERFSLCAIPVQYQSVWHSFVYVIAFELLIHVFIQSGFIIKLTFWSRNSIKMCIYPTFELNWAGKKTKRYQFTIGSLYLYTFNSIKCVVC